MRAASVTHHTVNRQLHGSVVLLMSMKLLYATEAAFCMTLDAMTLQEIAYLYLFGLVLQCIILVPYIIKASHAPQTPKDICLRVADLVIYAAPPGVPLVIQVIGVVARGLLRQDGLELLFPEIIQRGAAVDVVCFDKTGTLTESTVSCTCSQANHCMSASICL